MKHTSENLKQVFAILKPDSFVDKAAVSPELYGALNDNYAGFGGHTLIACHEFSSSWDTWEMHPAGDEVVVLLSGSATMVYWRNDEEETVELNEEGSFIVVPAGVWHTARVSGATTMLFITPGAGTMNADQPGAAA